MAAMDETQRKKLEEQKKYHEENMNTAIDKGNQDMYKEHEGKWNQCRKDLGEDVEKEQEQDNSCEKQ